MRQDDVPQRGRRSGSDRRGRAAPRGSPDHSAGPRPGHGVPATEPAALAHGHGQRRLRPRDAGRAPAPGDRGAHLTAHRPRRPPGLRACVSVRALGWHAAACESRARARNRSGRPPPGRTLRGARRADARAHAAGADQDLERHPKTGGVRDARHRRGRLSRRSRHRLYGPAGPGEALAQDRSAAATQPPHQARSAIRRAREHDLGVHQRRGRERPRASHGMMAGGARKLGTASATHHTRALPRVHLLRRYRATLQGAVAVAAFLLIWHGVAAARFVTPLFLPGPVDVAEAGVELFSAPQIWNDLLVSGREFGLGYALAAFTAIPVGLLMGWYHGFRHTLDPFISFLYATPRVVLLPLFIIWFGIGENSKIALVFLGAFFSIVISTTVGVRSLDPSLLRVARSFNATDRHIFRTIALPGSVPFILTGLRLGIGHALIAVVVGELVAAQAGIGLRIAIAGATFQTAKVFAGVVVVASTGMLLTAVLSRLEARFDRWRPRSG